MKKILYKFSWIFLVLAFVKFHPSTVSGVSETIVYQDITDSLTVPNANQPIAIIGDLQRTSIWEMMLGRHQNDTERQLIINQVRNEDPSLIVLLGDMVYDGGNEDQWAFFDRLLEPVKQIPVLPVIGNHEYYGSSSQLLNEHIRKRFPQFSEQSWYSRVERNIAMIFLDSNEPSINAEKWDEQQVWFKKMLSAYDADPAIKGILVFMHHPPYTNSIVTGDEKNIQNTFVKPFNASEKTLAFFSGHAHTYERFIKEDKSFIVSGGGGAPRVIIKKGNDCHEDQCKLPGIRPFHFILLQPGENNVNITVKGLHKGDSKFFTLDNFKLSFNKVLAVSE